MDSIRRINRHTNCTNCQLCQFCKNPASTSYQACTCNNIRLLCSSCRNLRQSTTIVGTLQLRVPTASTTTASTTITGQYTPPHRRDPSTPPTYFDICCCGDIVGCISTTKCTVKNPPHCGRECDICEIRKRKKSTTPSMPI